MSGGSGSRRDGADAESLPELAVPEAAAGPGSATLAGQLGERYQVLARLGTGAFGEVYRAHDRVLSRDVAIKRVRLEAFVEPGQLEEVKARFLREAQVAARLRHPNIVTTHDIVSSPSTSFIVMELIEGRTLQSLLATRGRLPLAETTDLLEQVAAALDHAHASQVVHRDVKPANIMVEPSGQVKVMDFGVAKLESGTNLTASGLIMGTPNYMSPEQARGGKVDARSDLFSLGCVAYECLTGVRPFQADSVTAILVKILLEDPPPVDFESTGLPRTIDAVLRRATAKEPAARFGSGRELVEALRAAVLPSPAPAPRTVVSKAAQDEEVVRRRIGPLVAGALMGGLALAAVAWLVSSRLTGPTPVRRPGSLVVEQPRGLLDRLLGRSARLAITLPEGTPLRLTLETPLSSATAVAGEGLSALTTSPVRIEGVEAVPRGSRVEGRVTEATSAARAGGRGQMTLVIESLDLDGVRIELRTRPLSLRAPPPRRRELARKRDNSLIAGLSEVGAAVEGFIDSLKGGSGGHVSGGSAEAVAVTSDKGREVTLPAQASLSLELARPATVVRPKR